MATPDPKLLEALEENWRAEKPGAIPIERSPIGNLIRFKQKLGQLADAEEHHASLWAKRLRELGAAEPIYRGELTGEADGLKNASEGQTWPCGDWRSTKAAISRNMAAS